MTGRPPKPLHELADFAGFEFTDVEARIVQNVLSRYNGQRLKTARKHIARLRKGGVSLDDTLPMLLERNMAIGRDSSSLHSMALRYGDETATRMFALKNEKCSITRAKLEAKFGVNNADQIIRSRGASLSNYVKRHGEEIGTQKWATYLAKRAAAYARRHEEGYEFARYTEDYYIGLYGEERGKEVFADRIRKQRYKVSRQRYIDEYGIGLGEDICRRVKTNTSRSAFIERYGETEGLARFNACVDKREQSRTYSHSSRAADSFFSLLVEILGLDRNECAFGEGAEKFFFLTEEERHVLPQRVIAVDFVLGHKVIEYHGDMVHANPRLCSADDRPHPWDKELTAQEIWDRDHARHQILRGRGYDVLVVWEDEAIQPDTFEICKTFLKGESCKTRL